MLTLPFDPRIPTRRGHLSDRAINRSLPDRSLPGRSLLPGSLQYIVQASQKECTYARFARIGISCDLEWTMATSDLMSIGPG